MNPSDAATHAPHAHANNPQPALGRVSLFDRLARPWQQALAQRLGGANQAPAEAGDETAMHSPCL